MIAALFAVLLAALICAVVRVYQLGALLEGFEEVSREVKAIHEKTIVDLKAIHEGTIDHLRANHREAMRSLRDEHAAELLGHQQALQRVVGALSDEQVAKIQSDIERRRVERARASRPEETRS